MKNLKDKPLGSATATEDHSKVENIAVACACGRDITLSELISAYPDRKKETIEKFLPEINATMRHYEITSCIRKVHFLAQVGHESSELKYTAEILEKGKTEEKAYGGYKGRGLMQLTFIGNYEAYGLYIQKDLTGANRLELEEPKLATDSAGWYWAAGRGTNLNTFADQNDALYITASINGGFNGYEGEKTSRLRLLKNAIDALHVKACPQLEALFAAFPEVEKFNYDSYTLEKSKANDMHDMAFAWGFWHDPKSKRKGTKKDALQAKLGYSRYLELLTAKPLKAKNGRFGFKKRENMKLHVETRIKEL
ncbi:MAG: hypothetical protein HHJ09_09470 [Glaciimonas sp.]|nr:hypothetical protein [Glaciimonas sp.]